MQYAIGYQLPDVGGSFVDLVRDYAGHIAEVYFPWGTLPSGRMALTAQRGYIDWSGQQQLEQDLIALRELGVKLDLLFNANCYGGRAISESLQNLVISILGHLSDIAGGVDVVTTTSPAIAVMVKRHFPTIEVRASVNMRIGTIPAMEYVADLFDAYYVQREYNRDLDHLHVLKQWADANGKRLYMLANSACLWQCSGQSFHDNLVAHEQDIMETHNITGWEPNTCWRYFATQQHWAAFLRGSWIRPEDLHHYEDLFPVVKLATRMHTRPRLVVQSYVQRRFCGSLPDLFEPGFSRAFAPYLLDNTAFPDDWFTQTSTCNHHCHSCRYCEQVLERIQVKLSEDSLA